MGKTYLSTILFCFLFTGLMSAQPGKVKETWGELAEKANFLMEQGSYYSAAAYYKKALELNSGNMELKWKQAEAYRLGRDYKKASFAYNSIRKKIIKGRLKAEDYPLADYYYGMMSKQAGDCEEAEEALYQFTQEYDGSQGEEYKELAKVAFEGCRMSRSGKEPLVKVNEVDALGKKVNSKYTESSATVLSDGRLLYSSLKSDEPIEIETQEAVSRLYVAKIEDLKRVREVEKFGLALPGGLNHIGSASISPDESKLYVTLCEQSEGINVNCAIYVSTKNSGNDRYSWGRPQKLGINVNAGGSNSSTPFATQNSSGETVLFFSSDRPGGKGGKDIWVATGTGDFFDNVMNLGDNINTAGDELSPFIDDAEGYEDPRPRLYFSSNGHPSFGGLDIFMAYKNNISYAEWSKPENAGSLLNSAADDFSYVMSPDKTRGYFVSNRVGGYSVGGRTCCDDVFVADLSPPELEKVIIVDMMGKIYDENKKVKDDIEVVLYDVTSGKTEIDRMKSTRAGFSWESLELDKKYRVEIKTPGYETYVYDFTTTNLEESKIVSKDIYLVKKKPSSAPVPATCSVSGKILGDAGTTTKTSLASASVKIYTITAGKEVLFKELTTDNRGSFNIDLPKGERYRISASKAGYLNTSSTESTINADATCNKTLTLAMKEKRKNVSFRLENILYDYDSANLRSESIPNLEVLLKLLNDNPAIVIELGSHTDSRGSNSYNQKLSQERAQSVVDWLINRGVSHSRLVARGYGETAPIAPNENEDGTDNPDGRQLNRRTEFKIIGGVN